MRLKRLGIGGLWFFGGFVFLFIFLGFLFFFSGSIEQDNRKEKDEKEGMTSLLLTQCISERI